ncbi:MAG: carbohydrate ABC transporter permease [Caldilinea sp. CFX5]|nr:carbohydrate ABC transporter permease [Caldilinea sp. CFX5]
MATGKLSAHRRLGRRLGNPLTILTVLALGFLSLLMVFPFIWMISASLKVPATAFKVPPELWPYEWRFENYAYVLNHPLVPLPRFFLNSLKIATLITLGQLITCSLAAYAFARLRFPGRELIFLILLTALMVPSQITIIPIFIEMRTLKLIDSHAALILPALTSIFGVFMLRQYFLTIPDELEDAARIDGAGPVRIWWQIMLPLIGPALSTLAIITFTSSWNAFFGPLIFLNSWQKFTWPLGVSMLRGQYGQGSVSVIMAGITLGVIPVFVVFLLLQRRMIESIGFTGGIK